MTSRAGTWLDDKIFAELNEECATEPEPEAQPEPERASKVERSRITNKSGYRGVDRHGRGWRARFNGNLIGIFPTAIAASCAIDNWRAAQ